MTDIGSVCEHVIWNFSKCHAVFLETNYDEEMLENGKYPVYLKKRIRSEVGHLSNHQALELFTSHRAETMSHILLSHLSQDNNDPELVEKLFKNHAAGIHVAVASRYHESPVYRISGHQADQQTGKTPNPSVTYIQNKLF